MELPGAQSRLRYKLKAKSMAGRILLTLFKYGLLLSMAFVFLLPFLYMLVTSLKSPSDLADATIRWVPSSLYFENYRVAFGGLNYWNGLKNSVLVSALSTVGHVLSCAMAGYGLARFRFRGRTALLVVLVLTIIVPSQVTMAPMYILFSKVKLVNHILSVVLPAFFGMGLKGGVFIFIFRQFYTGVPYELEEAAKVDGCGPLRTFARIILPISAPPMLVTVILSFVWHWNDAYESAILLSSRENKLLSASLPDLYDVLINGATSSEAWEKALIYNEAVAMAATFLVILPLLIFFFICQHWFMEGVERSGIVG